MRPQQSTVRELINKVRARLRMRRLSQGLLITLAVAVVTFITAAFLANRYQQKQTLLIVLRFLPFLLTLGAAVWFVLLPLRNRLSDSKIARLIEERVHLDDRVTTAVEFSDNARDASPAILHRLVKDADSRVTTANANQIVNPRDTYAYLASAAMLAVLMIVSFWFFSPVSRGMNALYSPFDDRVSANAQSIEVTPKSGKAPRGSDQKIKATLNGFESASAQVFMRKLNDANWLATPMEPAKEQNQFQFTIFNIQDSVVFYVEANNIRSPEQTLEVVDLPYVKQIDLMLNFPAYTGLATKRIENGGDVAALKGTVVHVLAHLNAKAKAAHIVLNDGTRIPMSPDFENPPEDEFRFVGSFTVKGEGTYKIELTSEDGERYNGSNEYDITLLADAPPSVVIDKPGRDMKVTNIQEVFTEASAEDDYGVTVIEFYYQVNGGDEKRIALQDLKRDEPKTLSGSYTFFLEEMKLEVGDFISYYAKAKDNNGQESTSDIYFLEVRPFEREFRQSQQQGGGQGGGEQDSNALTRKQREIIAATFRVQREEKTYDAQEKEENFGAVALSQEKLKAEAETLVERIKRRMGAQLQTNQQFSKLVEYVTQASKEMDAAKDKLREKNTKEALPPEQRSLQNLLKAEAIFRDIQVAQGQSQGGGQQNQEQRDLADLFELQLDKMKNQYETVQRQQQSQQSQQQDEIARRLEELARRQQKELEQKMRSQQQGGGGGGASQRQQQQMIEEAQRLARELEKLSRDRRDPKMQEAAQQLQQAAEEMKRAQSQSSQGQSSQQSQSSQSDSSAQMQRALQRMEQARRMLNSSRQAGGQQNVQGLRQRAEDALKKQGEIEKSVDDLAKQGQSGDSDKKQQLGERKESLAEQISGLEQDIDQTARGMGQDKQQAADKLRDAANAIRRNRIGERIKQNNELINRGYFNQAKERERTIKGNIEEVLKNLQAAEGSATQRKGEGLEDAMNRARELANNLESLRRKMEGQQGNQQNGQQGQQAGQQANQQGQNNQQGNQQAQANQQGQNGRQGNQQRGNQQNGQQGNQQARNQQNGQQGNQQGQQGQPSGQPGNQQSQQNAQQGNQQGNQRGNQQGQQAGRQQNGQQRGGQQQGGQQAAQQQGQQGQQGQGQQGGQQQGGRQQGGQQAGQQGGRQPSGQQQGGQPGASSEQAGMQEIPRGGGGAPRTGDRQTGSEISQRLRDMEELRRSLRGNNDLTRMLDEAADNLRRINPNAFSDPAQMALLKSEVIDPLRQLEFELARRLQAKLGNTGSGALTDGDAPDRYRKTIEDYYRRLSSRTPGGQK